MEFMTSANAVLENGWTNNKEERWKKRSRFEPNTKFSFHVIEFYKKNRWRCWTTKGNKLKKKSNEKRKLSTKNTDKCFSISNFMINAKCWPNSLSKTAAKSVWKLLKCTDSTFSQHIIYSFRLSLVRYSMYSTRETKYHPHRQWPIG